MACNRFKDKVGYQGQSHEVKAQWPDGSTRTLGWQNGTDVRGWQSLAKAWQLKDLRAEPVLRAENESTKPVAAVGLDDSDGPQGI